MNTHHSADARTALMATYIARYANPRAGMRFTRATSCAAQSRELDADKGRGGSEGVFGARGRTIYNAGAHPIGGTKRGDEKDKCGALRELARIDGEEERRRRHGEQFLMAARGDFEEECSSSPTVSAAEMATAEELFALYIHNI